MKVDIQGLSQHLSFEDGVAVNYLVLKLPTGDTVQVLIDEATAQLVTTAFIKYGGAAAERASIETEVHAQFAPPPLEPIDRAMPDGRYSPLSVNSDGDTEFGGNYEDPALDGLQEDLERAEQRVVEAAVQPRPPQPTPSPTWNGGHRLRAIVEKDDAGNPVLRGPGFVDTDTLTGGRRLEGEEDVGSV